MEAVAFDFVKFFDIASKVTVTLGLLLVLVGGWKRIWVWGYQLTECENRSAKREQELRDEVREWKELYRRNEYVTDRSLSMHERQNRKGAD